jgi:transposase-like protein
MAAILWQRLLSGYQFEHCVARLRRQQAVNDDYMGSLSDEVCSYVFKEIRWQQGLICPYCHSKNITSFGIYKVFLQRYVCKKCGRHFNDKTATIFAESKLPLNKWFQVIRLMHINCSLAEISRKAHIDYNSAARLVNLLQGSVYLQEVPRKLGLDWPETPGQIENM